MKIRRLLIVSLILIILSIGAVSALEDEGIDGSDNLSEDCENVVLSEDSSEDKDLSKNNLEDLIEYSDDIDCNIEEEVTIYDDDEEDRVVYFYSSDKSQTGNLNVYVDNALKYTKQIASSDYDEYEGECNLEIYPRDLHMTSFDTYDVKVTFNGETIGRESVTTTYHFYVDVRNSDYYSDDDIQIGETAVFWIILPEDATGALKLSVNGKTYNVQYSDGSGLLSLSTANWKPAEYTVRATYEGDYKYPYKYYETYFSVTPKFDYPQVISAGENEYFTITANSEEKGSALIYRYYDNDDDNKKFIASFSISNGYGRYSLSGLSPGEYDFYVDYNIGNFEHRSYFSILVKSNTAGFSSSISSNEITRGSSVTVNLYGPKLNSRVTVYCDDKQHNTISLSYGRISDVISGLSLGNHKIKVFFDVNGHFFSKTYYVNVKNPSSSNGAKKTALKDTLKLNTVKVKKSAKKLVIKATLKIKGKAVKNQKIKFKFNKKSYKAKTNKKGVAKIIVKKSVLKKLKVGKKVKYQAKYGKLVVKKTAKVKK